MVEIRSRFPLKPDPAYGVAVRGELRLPFERRQKSRQRATLASGEEVAIVLPRGAVLRGGDWVVASDGRVIEVVAEKERVLHVECATPEQLARVAYHLGNRHVPVQVGAGWLRLAADHVLEEMVKGLGARVCALEAPFEPEAGAYGAHHRHDNESGHGGRIHEFGRGCVNPRLLQLVSPALPVGAYSYSQGLESAIDSGTVHDAASAGRWIGDVLELAVASLEAPLFLRIARSWAEGDRASAGRWNAEFVASRESAELRAETLQMGYSMRRLLHELGVPGTAALEAIDEISYPAAFAFAATAWGIEAHEALGAYLFAWIENQVLAAVKAIPLGQTDGQRLLLDLSARIEAAVAHAASLGDEDLFNLAPGLALACARHETLYSRLFRS